jgi:hypothetical protein
MLGLLAALVLGAAVGLRASLDTGGSPGDKARIRANGIATALNCAALFSFVCVPGARIGPRK